MGIALRTFDLATRALALVLHMDAYVIKDIVVSHGNLTITIVSGGLASVSIRSLPVQVSRVVNQVCYAVVSH